MVAHLIYSNRLEELYHAFKERFNAPKVVMVPSPAVKQWLQMQLAEDLGIAAGIEFRFLRGSNLLDLSLKIETLHPGMGEHLAAVFNDYTLYGKPKLSGWEEKLWQTLGLKQEPYEGEVHLFGFNHIPPCCAFENATFYVLSPCQMYWEDIRSGSEREWMQRFFRKQGVKEKELLQLDELLQDVNPLLANWGRLGREFTARLGEGEERYVPPEGSNLLEKVQTDLLLLEKQEHTPDDSIQVHTAMSRLHEVQVLYDVIMGMDVYAHEIAVMAPDIEPYVAYIRAIFKDIPFSITEVQLPPDLELLFRLVDGRWGATELLPLMPEHAGWIRQAGIRWGRDAAHQKEILGDYSYEDVTWERGLQRLLDQLTITGEIPFSAADDLDAFFSKVESLMRDADRLRGEKTVAEWHRLLYELSEFDLLQHVDCDGTFSFETMRRILGKTTGQIHQPHSINGIRFSSIKPTPAKIICLLGMDEASFPRTTTRRPFDRLETKPPSPPTIDRYHFLESFLSAREQFMVFYSRFQQGEKLLPSTPVQDLIKYTNIEEKVHHIPPYKEEKKPFVQPSPTGVITIDLRELKTSASDPARLYLQSIGIRLQEETPLSDHEDLIPDPLTQHKFVWEKLGEGVEPSVGGPMQTLALERINKRAEEIQTSLAAHQITAQDLSTVEIEPIEISINENLTVRLVGELPNVTPQGLLTHGRRDLPNLIKSWPTYLAYAMTHPEGKLLFTRNKKSFSFEGDPKEQLKHYLRFHLACRENLAPLSPDWIPPLLKGKKIDKMPLYMSPYLERALATKPNFHEWQELLGETYGDLLAAWESK